MKGRLCYRNTSHNIKEVKAHLLPTTEYFAVPVLLHLLHLWWSPLWSGLEYLINCFCHCYGNWLWDFRASLFHEDICFWLQKGSYQPKKSLSPWESIQKWCQTLHVDNVSLSVANQALSVDKTLMVVVTQKVTLQPFRVYLQDRFQNFW